MRRPQPTTEVSLRWRSATPLAGGAGRSPAFTLIELLVVVAIIALLIAILLPGLSGARNQAKKIVCMNNNKRLSEAHFLYASDFKDTLPHADYWLWDGINSSGLGRPYAHLPESGQLFGNDRLVVVHPLFGRKKKTRNYVHFAEIYLCPLDSRQRRDIPGVSNYLRPAKFSYTRNARIIDELLRLRRATDSWYLKTTQVPRPAETCILLEEHELSPMNDGYVILNQWDNLTLRHSKRAVLCYHDGHAGLVDSVRFNEGSDSYRLAIFAPGLWYK
jgi:prepilin-type N-terminal cleavage/methylation domain-containing protein/prepilin-type processing-associated H-X9-DG protein